MSLVPAYQKTKEGSWVKEPRVSGPGWFICWDDDDPIELVVRVEVDAEKIISHLSKKGWDVKLVSKHQSEVRRMFSNKFLLANAYWIVSLSLPPEGLLQGEKFQEHPCKQGVYYQ